jgi:hypothetical protein
MAVTKAQVKPTTTDAGALVESDEHSLTVGPDGPILLQDHDMVRSAYTLHAEDDDWGQAGTMVREVLDDAARERLVSNVAGLFPGLGQLSSASDVRDHWFLAWNIPTWGLPMSANMARWPLAAKL